LRIFLTGHLGNVGSVLAEKLIKNNFHVTGTDIGYFPNDFLPTKANLIKNIKKDIRDVTKEDLTGHDIVIHLAALSNDSSGEINPSLTTEINHYATVNLAKIAKNVGVKKFLYASTCSIYGINKEVVNENSELNPLTAYAKSKADSEKDIIKLNDTEFSPVILRCGTVYGLSPSFRLDLVVNNLTGSAFTTGVVKLFSDGSAFRPLLHVNDMVNAFIELSKSPNELVGGEIYNIGSNDDNYTVKEIAALVGEVIPNSEIKISKNAFNDSRSYKVDFSKIKNHIGYKTKQNLKEGIKEIYNTLKEKKFSEKNFKNKNFYRVKYLKWLIEKNFIDNELRLCS